MTNTKKLTLMACFLAVALILSYIESLIPLPISIPGVKLGLPNIISLIILSFFGLPETLLIVFGRVMISGFLFGTMSSILYALSGGIISALIMAVLLKERQKKQTPSLVFVSVIGAISHNIGQLIVAAFVIRNLQLLVYYLPFLVLLAIPTGLVTGTAAVLIKPGLEKFNPIS